MMWWQKKREQELDRELRDHLDLEAEEQQGRRPIGNVTLGNVTLVKENVREAWGWMWLDRLAQDLRYTARVLRRSPGFTAVAVLSLAIGIGANTALFSALDAVLWKSVPVSDPRALRILTWIRTDKAPIHSHSGYTESDRKTGQRISGSFSYSTYRAFRDSVSQLADVVAFARNQFTITAAGAGEYADGQFVSGNYFTSLGVRASAGRALVPDDDGPGKPPVIVLTYRYWEKRFGLDPRVIGSRVVVNQTSATIIGVAAPTFQGLFPGYAVDLFVPISMVPVVGPRWFSLSDPYNWWVQVFARLRPGATDASAAAAAEGVLAREIEGYAGSPGTNVEVPHVLLQSGARGVPLFAGNQEQSLYTLAAVVAAVLFIACINMANLLLARSEARRREIAVRLSIGAARARVIRQLLTESLALSGFAAAAGALLAKPLLQLVLRMMAGTGSLSVDARVDSRTLLFTLCASILTGLLFGILPAFRATRVDLTPALKDAGAASMGGRSSRKIGGLLVAAQVAFSIVLLAGAGLFVRTLVNLMTVDIGIRSDHLLTFQTDASQIGYRGQRLMDLYTEMRARLEAIPGVASVGMSHIGLLQASASNTDFYIPGRRIQSQRFRTLYLLLCSDSFLSTMRIPVLGGRDLSAADGPGAPHVAVVNETFVREYLAGENPVGQTIVLGDVNRPKPDDEQLTVVGLAKDAHYARVRDAAPPTAYLPYRQAGHEELQQMTFAIRTYVPPLTIASATRKTAAQIDPNLPIAETRTMDDQVSESIHTERLIAALVSGFGIAAALLAAIGLFGVMAYAVARRNREIGIRLALGATKGRVRWMMLRESVATVLAGLAAGLPSALGLSRLVEKMLYGIRPHDAWSFIAAALLMILGNSSGGRSIFLDKLSGIV
ncbi:MAG TPA: ABC transporter permease [Bryobacteraceae bacterium]